MNTLEHSGSVPGLSPSETVSVLSPDEMTELEGGVIWLPALVLIADPIGWLMVASASGFVAGAAAYYIRHR